MPAAAAAARKSRTTSPRPPLNAVAWMDTLCCFVSHSVKPAMWSTTSTEYLAPKEAEAAIQALTLSSLMVHPSRVAQSGRHPNFWQRCLVAEALPHATHLVCRFHVIMEPTSKSIHCSCWAEGTAVTEPRKVMAEARWRRRRRRAPARDECARMCTEVGFCGR